MKTESLRLRAFAFAAGVVMLAVSCLASADPPANVIRLAYTAGAVSFSPAGEDDWVQAAINRPLTVGDRLWVDSGARAELQIGGAVLRLDAGTSVTVLNLGDNISQLQLTQGTMNVRVRRFDPNQMLEVDTPNLAFTVRQAGEYRIAVDAQGNASDIIVRKGRGEVYGEGASYVVDSRQPYRFIGTGLREYEPFAAPRVDDFDRWALDRDRIYDTSISARYVSPDVIGYQDLDANGTWGADPSYGNVWFPNRVEAGWAPYRDGHWAWVDPWGWTWVDDAPWGFAVSHYGRWTNLRGRWGWVPGPVRTRAYYAPALVAFVGGSNFQLSISSGNVGGVAWFPLGPREVYRPSYSVSRRYFENVNRSNTVINNTVINNYYNNTNVTNVTYANRQVPGAVVAVPTTAFVQSQQVARSAVRVTPQMAANGPVAQVAAVAPTERSVRGAAAQGGTPPARVFERPVVARTAPAPAQASFAAQQQQLQTRQGRPLDAAERKQIKAAPAAPAPVVNVVTQPKATAPTALIPPAGSAGKDARVRGVPAPAPATAGAPAQGAARAPVAQPGGTAQGTTPGQVAQPGAAAQPPERANAARGTGQQRGRQPDATPPTVPQAATPAPAPAAPPRVATPAPTTPSVQPQASPPPMAAPGLQPRVGSPSETRTQPPPQRSAQPRTETPPQVAAPTPSGVPAPQQQAAQPRPRPMPQQQVAPPAATAQQPAPMARPESVPVARQQPEQRRAPAAQQQPKPEPAPAATRQPQQVPPVAARQAPPQQPPVAARQAQPVPPVTARQAQQAPPGAAAQETRPAGGRGNNKKDDDEQQKREEEARKKKG